MSATTEAGRPLKIFAWDDHHGGTYLLACGSRAEAARIAQYSSPRYMSNLREIDDAYGTCRLASLAAARPRRILHRRRNGGVLGSGTTLYDGETPIARTVVIDDPSAPGHLMTREALEWIGESVQAEADGEGRTRQDGPQPSADRSPLRHVRLGRDLDARLSREARRSGAPAAELVRRAVDRYLAE